MYDDIMKAETFAETYVAISKMSNEEVNNLLRDLVGPNKDNVPNAPNLPLTPKEMERINRMKQAGKNMPLTVQDKKFLTDAVRNAKKRKVNQKRTKFQQALNQPRKVENPVRRARRLGQTQQPAQQQYNDPKTSNAMAMFREVQENKRRRLGQQPQQQVPLPQQNVPLPKTQRTMSNEEMQRRMKARREREQSQQQSQQQPQQTQQQPFPPAPPRQIPFPPPSQQPQQTQQLPPRVKSLLQRPRRRIQRRPVTVNPDA